MNSWCRTGSGLKILPTVTVVPTSRAAGERLSSSPPRLNSSVVATCSLAWRVVTVSAPSAASALSASPRKPKDSTDSRSANVASLEVWWRSASEA